MPVGVSSPEAKSADSAGTSRTRFAAITGRAIVVGAFLAAVLALINPWTDFAAGLWGVGYGFVPAGAVVSLILLVSLNGLLSRLVPRWAFARNELLVIYGMLLVSVHLIHECLPYTVSVIAYPFYAGGLQPDWEQIIFPHIPLWLRLGDVSYASWFWQGAPEGAAVPWRAWIHPLVAWSSFTLALMAAMYCLAALLRRDWIEGQRLTFPLVEIPVSIAGDSVTPSLRSSILNSRVFWVGFSIPAAISLLNWLNTFIPSVPGVNLVAIHLGRFFIGMPAPWNALENLHFSILFPVIGVSYFLRSDISLSLWMFYLFFWVRMLAWSALGLTGGGSNAGAAIDPYSFIHFEEAGGFVAFSAVIIWQSREAFRAAWRGILGRAAEDPDPSQPLAGRWALLGFLTANTFMLWWLMTAGMSWWSFALYMGLFYAISISTSRLVAAAGIIWVQTGFFPHDVLLRTLGSSVIGPASLTMLLHLAHNYNWESSNLAMPQMMNSFKLLHSGRISGNRFAAASALALAVVIVAGTISLLAMVHRYGASSLGEWPFTSWPQRAFGDLDSLLRNPRPAEGWVRLAMAAGFVFTLALSWLHSQFIWWPLSPFGFLIASSWSMNWLMWPGILIGWSLSTLIRRYGGLKLFRALRPAFIGLIVGGFITGTVLAALSGILGISVRAGG